MRTATELEKLGLVGPSVFISAQERFVQKVAKVRDTAQCILWPFGLNGMGYGHFRRDGRTTYAHSAVCILAHGPRPRGNVTAHSCGKPACVNPRHLRWATQFDNAIDRARHGRGGLVPEVRAAIREASGKQADIAKRFGVHYATVYRIKAAP